MNIKTKRASVYIKRYLFLALVILLFGFSAQKPPVIRSNLSLELAEYRVARKQRSGAVTLPERIPRERISSENIVVFQLDLSKKYLEVSKLYQHPYTRDAVIDFFIQMTGDEEIALATLYYADKSRVDPMLAFSVMQIESGFKRTALNRNPSSNSEDRGLFQLNNTSFPHLTIDDFENIDTNIRHGLQYLAWCLSATKGDTRMALVAYNAGMGRVRAGIIPATTQIYIRKAYSTMETMHARFSTWMKSRFAVHTSDTVQAAP